MLHETRALPRATGEVVPLGEAPNKSLHSWGDAFETTRGRDLVEEMVELHFHRGCQAAPEDESKERDARELAVVVRQDGSPGPAVFCSPLPHFVMTRMVAAQRLQHLMGGVCPFFSDERTGRSVLPPMPGLEEEGGLVSQLLRMELQRPCEGAPYRRDQVAHLMRLHSTGGARTQLAATALQEERASAHRRSQGLAGPWDGKVAMTARARGTDEALHVLPLRASVCGVSLVTQGELHHPPGEGETDEHVQRRIAGRHLHTHEATDTEEHHAELAWEGSPGDPPAGGEEAGDAKAHRRLMLSRAPGMRRCVSFAQEPLVGGSQMHKALPVRQVGEAHRISAEVATREMHDKLWGGRRPQVHQRAFLGVNCRVLRTSAVEAQMGDAKWHMKGLMYSPSLHHSVAVVLGRGSHATCIHFLADPSPVLALLDEREVPGSVPRDKDDNIAVRCAGSSEPLLLRPAASVPPGGSAMAESLPTLLDENEQMAAWFLGAAQGGGGYHHQGARFQLEQVLTFLNAVPEVGPNVKALLSQVRDESAPEAADRLLAVQDACMRRGSSLKAVLRTDRSGTERGLAITTRLAPPDVQLCCSSMLDALTVMRADAHHEASTLPPVRVMCFAGGAHRHLHATFALPAACAGAQAEEPLPESFWLSPGTPVASTSEVALLALAECACTTVWGESLEPVAHLFDERLVEGLVRQLHESFPKGEEGQGSGASSNRRARQRGHMVRRAKGRLERVLRLARKTRHQDESRCAVFHDGKGNEVVLFADPGHGQADLWGVLVLEQPGAHCRGIMPLRSPLLALCLLDLVPSRVMDSTAQGRLFDSNIEQWLFSGGRRSRGLLSACVAGLEVNHGTLWMRAQLGADHLRALLLALHRHAKHSGDSQETLDRTRMHIAQGWGRMLLEVLQRRLQQEWGARTVRRLPASVLNAYHHGVRTAAGQAPEDMLAESAHAKGRGKDMLRTALPAAVPLAAQVVLLMRERATKETYEWVFRGDRPWVEEEGKHRLLFLLEEARQEGLYTVAESGRTRTLKDTEVVGVRITLAEAAHGYHLPSCLAVHALASVRGGSSLSHLGASSSSAAGSSSSVTSSELGDQEARAEKHGEDLDVALDAAGVVQAVREKSISVPHEWRGHAVMDGMRTHSRSRSTQEGPYAVRRTATARLPGGWRIKVLEEDGDQAVADLPKMTSLHLSMDTAHPKSDHFMEDMLDMWMPSLVLANDPFTRACLLGRALHEKKRAAEEGGQERPHGAGWIVPPDLAPPHEHVADLEGVSAEPHPQALIVNDQGLLFVTEPFLDSLGMLAVAPCHWRGVRGRERQEAKRRPNASRKAEVRCSEEDPLGLHAFLPVGTVHRHSSDMAREVPDRVEVTVQSVQPQDRDVRHLLQGVWMHQWRPTR